MGIVALLTTLLTFAYWGFNQWRRSPDAPYKSYKEPSFGPTGIVESYNAIAARAITVLKDGKILVAGLSSGSKFFDISVLRFLADGSPDRSFGKDGTVTVDFGGNEQINAMQVGEGGKIWLTGEFSEQGDDPTMGVVRLESDGRPDTTFGRGGIALLPLKGETGLGRALALLPGKGVAIAGFVTRNSVRRFAVAQLQDDGRLDPAFGKGGMAETPIGTAHGEAFALGRQADGKLVAVGYGKVEKQFRFVAVKYLSNGTPDPEFGEAGVASSHFTGVSNYPYAALILPSGEILAAGASGDRTNYDFALAQWTANGKPDEKFGDNGLKLIPIGGGDDTIYALFRQPNGKVIAAGASGSTQSPNAISLARILPNGTPDRWFGLNGIIVTATQSYAGYAVDVQPNGKIVVTGNRVDPELGNIGIFVARYLPDGSLDAR